MLLVLLVLAIPLTLGAIGTYVILSMTVTKLIHGEKIKSPKLMEWLSLPVEAIYLGWIILRWYWLALRGIPAHRRYLY
jgi:hypothetical protein